MLRDIGIIFYDIVWRVIEQYVYENNSTVLSN